MQKQVLEGMTQHGNSQQCVPYGQINIPKGQVKRQVVKAWMKIKSNEGVGSKTLGSQYQCQYCKHYGFPCLRNKPTKKEVKVNPNCEANVDKKRKANSLEPVLGSDQHLSSTTLSHPALIPRQINSDFKELEVFQAKVTPLFPHEVCIDGWTITYKEFQPRRIKRAKKRSSQTKMNLQSQQADNTLSNNSVEYDIMKDPAKRKCYLCQQEGHYIKSSPQKNQPLHHENSQSQITTGLPPGSVSDNQPGRSTW